MYSNQPQSGPYANSQVYPEYGQQPPQYGYAQQPQYGQPTQQQYSQYPPQPQQPYYQPPPPVPPPIQSSSEKFSTNRKYKDVWAAILFVVFLLGFLACVAVGFLALKTEVLDKPQQPSNEPKTSLDSLKPADFGILFGGSAVFGAVLSLVYFIMLQKYAHLIR